MDQPQKRQLGRTDLRVSRIGFGGSFNAPTSAYEEGFEAGINVFYWGSIRRGGMGRAIRNLAPRHRDELVVVVQSYARLGTLVKASLCWALRRLRLERADILLLGMHNKPPSRRVMDAALKLREQGLCRAIAVSCHHRPTFQKYIEDRNIDVIMLRYNACHRGAEKEVFPFLPAEGGPGVFGYTATRWGHLLDAQRIPPELGPLSAADCYRFVLARPEIDLVFCGPSERSHVQEAIRALRAPPMSEEELERARRIGDYVYQKRSHIMA